MRLIVGPTTTAPGLDDLGHGSVRTPTTTDATVRRAAKASSAVGSAAVSSSGTAYSSSDVGRAGDRPTPITWRHRRQRVFVVAWVSMVMPLRGHVIVMDGLRADPLFPHEVATPVPIDQSTVGVVVIAALRAASENLAIVTKTARSAPATAAARWKSATTSRLTGRDVHDCPTRPNGDDREPRRGRCYMGTTGEPSSCSVRSSSELFSCAKRRGPRISSICS